MTPHTTTLGLFHLMEAAQLFAAIPVHHKL